MNYINLLVDFRDLGKYSSTSITMTRILGQKGLEGNTTSLSGGKKVYIMAGYYSYTVLNVIDGDTE